jgi:hypothetical protein
VVPRFGVLHIDTNNPETDIFFLTKNNFDLGDPSFNNGSKIGVQDIQFGIPMDIYGNLASVWFRWRRRLRTPGRKAGFFSHGGSTEENRGRDVIE